MIIVTRPTPYGEELVKLLNEAGLSAKHIPLFKIIPVGNFLELQTKLEQLSSGDIVIVISPQVLNVIAQCHRQLSFPPLLQYVAIGKKTAKLLQHYVATPVIYPVTQENSESLLLLPELQHVTERRILILRGNCGRELLATTLQSRGAVTEYYTCYQRHPIKPALNNIQDYLIDKIITITNTESLLYFEQLIDEAQKRNNTLLVSSPRIAEKATKLGWHKIITINSADNRKLFKTLITLCHNG
ncbi:MAG: uroporphyrinogen-III synthase [Candidatus Schmidhempelia sp.]|nr:uroporphyrinogen-III synthase [Candidatus Schmidhempelia sp.]